jgi:hypothetical protein
MTEAIQQTQSETKPEAIALLRQQEWYIFLIEELDATKTEGEYNARWELLKTYHAIGKILTEQLENFSREQIYGSQIYETVAEDINKSKVTVYKAVQFYKKYPNAIEDVSSLPEGKNISWSKIVKKYLSEPKQLPEQSNETIPEKEDLQINNAETIINNTNNINILDISIYTIKDNINLFLELRSLYPTNNHLISSTIVKHLLKRFTAYEIKTAINIYAKGKSPEENIFLIELESKINITPTTNPLIENFLPPLLHTDKPEIDIPETKPAPVRELVSQYRQIYMNKFNRPPSIGTTSWGKYGKLLKAKITQGYTLEEIIVLLKVFSKSPDSNPERLGFNLSTFFSDSVFNKMLALKSKNSNQVPDGKYNKYED